MTSDVKDDGTVMPLYVNQLVVWGHQNGVLNLKFATARFSAELGTGNTRVSPDLCVTCDLRMDLWCAQQLRDRLTEIIEQNTAPAGVKPN